MTKRTCSTVDCTNPHYGRGWCKTHYDKARRSGRLTDQPRTKALDTDSLDTRLRNIGWTVTDRGCWEWNGARTPAGYGTIQAGKGQPEIASRVAYEAWVSPPAPENVVCHKCDNPPCMNPAHLFEGTHQDNITDMVKKRRVANGERRKSKLTDVQVAEIRALYVPGDVTQDSLAEKYDVSQRTISDILLFRRRKYETWRLPA